MASDEEATIVRAGSFHHWCPVPSCCNRWDILSILTPESELSALTQRAGNRPSTNPNTNPRMGSEELAHSCIRGVFVDGFPAAPGRVVRPHGLSAGLLRLAMQRFRTDEKALLCGFYPLTKNRALSSSSGTYWLACLRIARRVPVSSSLCRGIVSVCLHPCGATRRGFTWLPAWA
jgi:hypothetical protein